MVNPKPGESFLSWLTRQAWAFSITPKKLVQSEKEYWLIKENISLSVNREWLLKSDVLPISTAWENVLQQRGLNIEMSELQSDISKWFDLASEPKITKKILKNYYLYVLRYCPLCWKDENSRYFRTLWRLPFVLVCPDHGIELKESCSSCGALLFNKIQNSSVIIFQDLNEKSLINCRHCSHSLLQETVEEKPELASLQKKILNTLLSDSNWAEQRGYLIFWHTYLTAIEKQRPESVEKSLKLMDTILKRPLLIPNSKYYSVELLAEIECRLQAMTLYLSGNLSKKKLAKFDLTIESSILVFVKELLKGKPIDETIKRLGYMGKLGLELARSELREFRDKYERLPKINDKEMGAIKSAITRQEWASFGIKKWNDMLRNTFGEVNTNKGLYAGKQGLEQAIAELLSFKAKNGRLPISKDKEMDHIKGAIARKEWVSWGIKKWNDLLMKTFEEVNFHPREYVGKRGFEWSIAKLLEFKALNGRLPRCGDKEMSVIIKAINRKEWIHFGIKNWNDLLIKTFGEVNFQSGIYSGEQGLKRAIIEMQEFKLKKCRLPKCNDKQMGGISGAIGRKEWVAFGIVKWNDLLKKTFGEVNHNFGAFAGEQGLEKAMNELCEFKVKHNRLPTYNDKEIRGIIRAITRGEWVRSGIMKWNDLLIKIFGEVNIEKGVYAGKQGFERAVAQLKEFKVKHGRLPKASDKEMDDILGGIKTKKWINFGIKKWNDLLIKTFGEVNREKGVYLGEHGLERAIAQLKDFKVKYSRLPHLKDNSGISGAIYHKEWVAFGVKKWNDLLIKTFGEVNRENGVYTGEQGLEKAINKLREFKVIRTRLPRCSDKEISCTRSSNTNLC